MFLGSFRFTVFAVENGVNAESNSIYSGNEVNYNPKRVGKITNNELVNRTASINGFEIIEVRVDNLEDLRSEINAAPEDGTPIVILIDGDIVITSSAISVTSGRNIILLPYNDNVTLAVNGMNRHFIVNTAASLTIGCQESDSASYITLQGRGGDLYGGGVQVTNSTFILNSGVITYSGGSGNYAAGVRLLTGGTFIMNGGTIRNNRAPNGAGVLAQPPVDAANVVFTMNGGTIRNNTATQSGGGVFLNRASFTMNDGYIIGNYSNGVARTDGGGGIFLVDGEVAMHGGTISNNSATRGGGVFVNGGKFEILGTYASISRNFTILRLNDGTDALEGGGGGILVHGGTLNIRNGSISGNTGNGSGGVGGGGGVRLVNATVNMSGGKIDGNILGSPNGVGAGVMMLDSTFIMYGDASIISNNTVNGNNGGGVVVSGSYNTFVMRGNAVISDNRAGNGAGGVLVSGGVFNMKGGSIENNRINPAGQGGSGVVVSGGTFNMSDGTIRNHTENRANTAIRTMTGGGVRVNSGTFTMTGNAVIEGNEVRGAGGGVFVAGGTFTMNGGEIRNNQAISINGTAGEGGGINQAGGIVIINGGQIHNNIASNEDETIGNGGGVRIAGGTFTMNNGEINDNTAAVNGGGVAVSGNVSGRFTVREGSITNNHAGADGGGIHTSDYHYNHILDEWAYASLNISSVVIFNRNTAGNGHFVPPLNWYITNIRGADVSPLEVIHQLNNYDINFNFIPVTVEFNLSGGSTPCGNMGIKCECNQFASQTFRLGQTAIRPAAPNPVRENFYFRGWAIAPQLTPDDDFNFITTAIYANKTLYAIWQPVRPTVDNANVNSSFIMGNGIPYTTVTVYIPGTGPAAGYHTVSVGYHGRWYVFVRGTQLHEGSEIVAVTNVPGYVPSEEYRSTVRGVVPVARLTAWYDWSVSYRAEYIGNYTVWTPYDGGRSNIKEGDRITVTIGLENISTVTAHNVQLRICLLYNRFILGDTRDVFVYCYIWDNVKGYYYNTISGFRAWQGPNNRLYFDLGTVAPGENIVIEFTVYAKGDFAASDVPIRIIDFLHSREHN